MLWLKLEGCAMGKHQAAVLRSRDGALRYLVTLVASLALVLWVACSGGGSGTSSCTPGQTSACTCTNGAFGSQSCQPSGSYGACACTGGGSSGSGGSSGAGDGGGLYLAWPGSANGATVLDANGNVFRFDASNGCMFAANTDQGPSGFCLTASSSSSTGYAEYGPTNCSNPATNTECDSATFDVVLTNNPSGTGCIAVLGNGSSASTDESPLAVTTSASSFLIQTTLKPGAYTAYWNGLIPACGGTNPYEGSYTSTTTIAAPSGYYINPTCILPTSYTNTGPPFMTLAIDGSGIIDSDALGITGLMSKTGAGAFSQTLAGNCVASFPIASVSQDSGGKWVITGTESLASQTFPFSFTQD